MEVAAFWRLGEYTLVPTFQRCRCCGAIIHSCTRGSHEDGTYRVWYFHGDTIDRQSMVLAEAEVRGIFAKPGKFEKVLAIWSIECHRYEQRGPLAEKMRTLADKFADRSLR